MTTILQRLQRHAVQLSQRARTLIKEIEWWWTWRRFVYTFVPLIHAAQDAGHGRRERWMEPDTSGQDILAWVDFQVATLTISGPCLAMSVLLLAYTSDEWAARPLSIDTPEAAMPWQQTRSRWAGLYGAWTVEGRAQIAAALDQAHGGLFVVVTADSAALAKILRDQAGRPSSIQAT